jgi:cation transport regulator
MPYKILSELPSQVQKRLPKHAQEIYRAAFNHAWEEYKDPKLRNTDETREVVSHKVAWSAVKKKYYRNNDGIWLEILN